jgi:hypothetical protein
MPSITKTLFTLLLATSVALALPTPQLAGEGAAANSILSSTDNGIGYGIEAAEENIAKNICQAKGSADCSTGSNVPAGPGGSGSAPPPPPPKKGPKARRQLDKISNGAQAISNAAGVGSSTSGLTNGLDEVDGSSTSGAANLGAEIGKTEEDTLISLGEAVPRA